MSLVHKKSMNLYDVSPGNACNVLNVDPGMVGYFARDLHDFWSLPISTVGELFLKLPPHLFSRDSTS